MTPLLLASRFATEIALLLGAFTVGTDVAGPRWAGWLTGVVLAALVAGLWQVWVAPRAERRLRDPGRLAAEVALFTVVGAALIVTGHELAGPVLTIVGVLLALGVRRVDADA